MASRSPTPAPQRVVDLTGDEVVEMLDHYTATAPPSPPSPLTARMKTGVSRGAEKTPNPTGAEKKSRTSVLRRVPTEHFDPFSGVWVPPTGEVWDPQDTESCLAGRDVPDIGLLVRFTTHDNRIMPPFRVRSLCKDDVALIGRLEASLLVSGLFNAFDTQYRLAQYGSIWAQMHGKKIAKEMLQRVCLAAFGFQWLPGSS